MIVAVEDCLCVVGGSLGVGLGCLVWCIDCLRLPTASFYGVLVLVFAVAARD